MNRYNIYKFVAQEAHQDILIALLGNIGFEAFEQDAEVLSAYIAMDQDGLEIREQIEQQYQSFFESLTIEEMPDKNWNEAWESSFQPIQVGDFCGVRASFHTPFEDVEHELIIDPKMAFGTGHHGTTWMMIAQMQSMALEGMKVLDFGAGTGILSILAAKMSALVIDAVEIESPAVENCIQNILLNNAPAVQCIEGDQTNIPDKTYDVILANVNRNVLLETTPDLLSHLSANGFILYSGILSEDERLFCEKIEVQPIILEKKMEKDGWISLLYRVNKK